MNNRKFVITLFCCLLLCLCCTGCFSTEPQSGFMIEQPTEGGPPEMYFYLDIPFNFRHSGGPQK